MSPQADNSRQEARAIRETLDRHSLHVENNINKIRALIVLVGGITDTVFLALSGKAEVINGSYLLISLIVFALLGGYFLVVHRLTSGSICRPWVKYLVVTIDFTILFITFFELFRRKALLAQFSALEMLWMSCFSLILFNSLSILRVEKRVIIYGTILALIINITLFSITEQFSLVLLYGSLAGILFFGIFNLWVAGNVARKLASAVRLSLTRDELAKTNRRLEETLAELQAAETQLVQSEKMAALGSLAAGIAHEVNNPIGAIISSADVIKRCGVTIENAVEQDEAGNDLKKRNPKLGTSLQLVNENCETIMMAGSRVSEIIKSMKNFVRLDEATYQKADINEGIESTLAILRHETKNVRLETEYGSIPQLNCSPNQLNQVFMNLIMNAVQAMDGTGHMSIATKFAADKIVITLSDSGPGIKPEHLDKVFDAGFTTKGVGVGTGLGLSISYAIVRQHRGTITVDSKPGQGTTFMVSLPVT